MDFDLDYSFLQSPVPRLLVPSHPHNLPAYTPLQADLPLALWDKEDEAFYFPPAPAEESFSVLSVSSPSSAERRSLSPVRTAVVEQPIQECVQATVLSNSVNVTADMIMIGGKLKIVSEDFSKLMRTGQMDLSSTQWICFVPQAFHLYYLHQINQLKETGSSSIMFDIVLQRPDMSMFKCQVVYSAFHLSSSSEQELIQINLSSVFEIQLPAQHLNQFSQPSTESTQSKPQKRRRTRR
jgi:hypothetical protein